MEELDSATTPPEQIYRAPLEDGTELDHILTFTKRNTTAKVEYPDYCGRPVDPTGFPIRFQSDAVQTALTLYRPPFPLVTNLREASPTHQQSHQEPLPLRTDFNARVFRPHADNYEHWKVQPDSDSDSDEDTASLSPPKDIHLTIISYGANHPRPFSFSFLPPLLYRADLRDLTPPKDGIDQRLYTGMDPIVVEDFWSNHVHVAAFETTLRQLRLELDFLEGDEPAEWVVLVNCYAGIHRSVAFASRLGKELRQWPGLTISMRHQHLRPALEKRKAHIQTRLQEESRKLECVQQQLVSLGVEEGKRECGASVEVVVLMREVVAEESKGEGAGEGNGEEEGAEGEESKEEVKEGGDGSKEERPAEEGGSKDEVMEEGGEQSGGEKRGEGRWDGWLGCDV